MRKYLILGLLLTNLFSAETVTVTFDEAVQINTKLIKYLYDENQKLKQDMESIKSDVNTLKGEIDIIKKTLYPSSSAPKNIWQKTVVKKTEDNKLPAVVKKITTRVLNIRTSPVVLKDNISGTTEAIEVIECKDIKDGWCAIDDKKFIWAASLKNYKETIYKSLGSAKLRVSPVDKDSNVFETLQSGKEVKSVGIINGWHLLNTGAYIKASELKLSK